MLARQLLVEFQIVFTGHLNTCTVTNNIQPQSLPPLMPVWMDEDSYSENINHDTWKIWSSAKIITFAVLGFHLRTAFTPCFGIFSTQCLESWIIGSTICLNTASAVFASLMSSTPTCCSAEHKIWALKIILWLQGQHSTLLACTYLQLQLVPGDGVIISRF